jgi:hypothetical protein
LSGIPFDGLGLFFQISLRNTPHKERPRENAYRIAQYEIDLSGISFAEGPASGTLFDGLTERIGFVFSN